MPAIASVAACFFGNAQVPPLSARVIVTVVPTVVALPEQVVKPLDRVTAGVAGTVKAALKPTVIVSPAASAPVGLLVVNPIVHDQRAPAGVTSPPSWSRIAGRGIRRLLGCPSRVEKTMLPSPLNLGFRSMVE